MISMDKIRVIELFAGIGSQTEALNKAGIPHDIVAISEVNSVVSRAYEVLHGEVNNLGDIRKIKVLPECDLLTYSFPCTDLSNQGIGRGMAQDTETESSLVWEVKRIILSYAENGLDMPEILLMENVKGIINRHHIKDFKVWIDTLSELGYQSSYMMIRGRDYGFPQERERVYMVSSRTKGVFKFPDFVDEVTPLTEYLDGDEYVSENDLVSEDIIQTMKYNKDIESVMTKEGIRRVGKCEGKFHSDTLLYDTSGVCPTILSRGTPLMFIFNYLDVVQNGAVPKIRRLTSRESFKLMGFSGDDYDRLAEEFSHAQIKRMAGNSIIVDVLSTIFKGIYIDESFHSQMSLDEY